MMLRWEPNKSESLGDCNISFFPLALLWVAFHGTECLGFAAPFFSYFWLYHFLCL